MAVDQGDKAYASLAKVALAQVLKAENKPAEGENYCDPWSIIRRFSSPRTRQKSSWPGISLPTNPQEARKILEPLRTERSAISRAALCRVVQSPAEVS